MSSQKKKNLCIMYYNKRATLKLRCSGASNIEYVIVRLVLKGTKYGHFWAGFWAKPQKFSECVSLHHNFIIIFWYDANCCKHFHSSRFIYFSHTYESIELPKFLKLGLDRTGHLSFSDQTGPDTQICWTGPAGPDWIQTYILRHFTYQLRVINSHKIRSLNTNLVSKVPRPDK